MKSIVGLFGLALAMFAGCGGGTYTCVTNAGCVTPDKTGQCLPINGGSYCAFPSADLNCPSMLKWDNTAPSSVRGQCVELPDMGTAPDMGVPVCVFDDTGSTFDNCVFGGP